MPNMTVLNIQKVIENRIYLLRTIMVSENTRENANAVAELEILLGMLKDKNKFDEECRHGLVWKAGDFDE